MQLHWLRGSRVIRAVTTRLDRAVQVGHRVIGHCYDPCVLTREDAPGSDRNGDTAAGLGPRQLVLRTVRRCGLLTPDGHALLDRSGLPLAVYGRRPARTRSTALEAAVAELLAERLLEPAVGSRDTTGRPHFPARPGERTIPLIGYRPALIRVIQPWGATGPVTGRMRGVQYVPGHLRRLLPERSASEAQRTAFGSTAADSARRTAGNCPRATPSSPSTPVAAESSAEPAYPANTTLPQSCWRRTN
ncbi:hypothetical protein O1L68_10150 [Streptomyces lydicus]|nr:hypothetical protein [Streptomyces lydicus]